MLLQNKTVAIIGGGPVGLTMARLLQQKGVAVKVYERDIDAQTRITGGTLDLHKDSGQHALDKAGLLHRYYALAVPMGRTVADDQGNVLVSIKTTFEERHDNPEINRNDLRKMLLESLTLDTVKWDSKLIALEEKNGQWLLHFENGTSTTADLVIGANGGMSKVRKYVTDAEIEYTGTLILQGEVLHTETACADFFELCGGNILMTASNGTLLVANPKNGNLLSYAVIFKKPEGWDEENGSDPDNTKSVRGFLANRLSKWNACYQQLIRSTSSFVMWPTRKISLDTPWKSNRPLPITLIGDAAHIMPPFAGQGVNIGMMDAVILSDNLVDTEFDTIKAAINNYEKQMMVYAKKAQLHTSINELAMLQPSFSFHKFYQ